jgi:hypothetical protein
MAAVSTSWVGAVRLALLGALVLSGLAVVAAPASGAPPAGRSRTHTRAVPCAATTTPQSGQPTQLVQSEERDRDDLTSTSIRGLQLASL